MSEAQVPDRFTEGVASGQELPNPPATFADLFFAPLLSRRSKASTERAKILLDLKREGLLGELQQALTHFDVALKLYLKKRAEAVEALVKVAKAIPRERRNDKWLWREAMRLIGFDPSTYRPCLKSLRHLRRQGRKLAEVVADANLSRAIVRAYPSGIVKIGDRLPSARVDGVEREVCEALSKLAAYYASGHYWILGRLRETLAQLEEHWKQLHGAT
jgi:hypothetical protein